MVLSSINTEITFVDWQNYILTIDMSPKQICYPNLDYILQINSKYGLFFCLPEIWCESLRGCYFCAFFSTVKEKTTKFNPSCRNVPFAVPDESLRGIF